MRAPVVGLLVALVASACLGSPSPSTMPPQTDGPAVGDRSSSSRTSTAAAPEDVNVSESGTVSAGGTSLTWNARVEDYPAQYRFQFQIDPAPGSSSFTVTNAEAKLTSPDGSVRQTVGPTTQTSTSAWRPINFLGNGTLAAGVWKLEFTATGATTARYTVDIRVDY